MIKWLGTISKSVPGHGCCEPVRADPRRDVRTPAVGMPAFFNFAGDVFREIRRHEPGCEPERGAGDRRRHGSRFLDQSEARPQPLHRAALDFEQREAAFGDCVVPLCPAAPGGGGFAEP